MAERIESAKTEIRERIAFVLAHRWAGRLRAMARDLKVSPALLSFVINGKQQAGPRLIRALQAHPGVNAEWLVTGNGDPLPTPDTDTLPIAVMALPGMPLLSPELLTGERFPVANAFNRDSRYWLRLSGGNFIPAVTEGYLRSGDLLLMEAAGEWFVRQEQVVDRFCAVRTKPADTSRAVLRWVRLQADQLVGLPIGMDQSTVELPPEKCPPTDPAARRRRTLRNVQDEAKVAPARSAASHGRSVRMHKIGLEDVVAVCVFMARSNPELT